MLWRPLYGGGVSGGSVAVTGAAISFSSGLQYEEALCCIPKPYTPVLAFSVIKFQLSSYHLINQDLSGENSNAIYEPPSSYFRQKAN